MLWQITDRIWTLDSFFLAPCSSSFLNVDGRIMSLVLKREFRETVFLREQIRAPTRFFIWHLVLTKILQITGKADDDPRVVVFFYHSFDRVRVGVPTARADLLYKSHILHACRIKLNDEVEDFYNSHCGWTSTGVLPCLNTHTHTYCKPKESVSVYFSSTLSEERRHADADSKSRASREEHNDAEWAKTQKEKTVFSTFNFYPVYYWQVLIIQALNAKFFLL